MRRGRPALVALSVALCGLVATVLAGSSGPVSAATTPWSVAVSPTTLTVGVATNVRLTVTAGSQFIRCVAVDVPAGFDVVRASVTSVPDDYVWRAAVAGSGPTRVTFNTAIEGWRLRTGETGVFTIRVVATRRPLAAWDVTTYAQSTVDPRKANLGPLRPLTPFVILPGPTPRPTPAPTRTPRPTPAPTRTPTPVPGATPGTGPTPATPSSPSSGPSSPSPSPLPSMSPATNPTPAGSGSGGSGAGEGPDEGRRLDVRALPASGTVQLDDMQAVGAIGMFAWLVPGLFLALPGFLIVLVVGVQAGLATGFVPLTRRIIGARRGREATARPRRR